MKAENAESETVSSIFFHVHFLTTVLLFVDGADALKVSVLFERAIIIDNGGV